MVPLFKFEKFEVKQRDCLIPLIYKHDDIISFFGGLSPFLFSSQLQVALGMDRLYTKPILGYYMFIFTMQD